LRDEAEALRCNGFVPSSSPIQGRQEACRCWVGPLPPRATRSMTNENAQPSAMREGACPYCERTVLVYEEPPRCPLCACPLDEQAMHPYVFPGDKAPVDPD
jgi:hypothetical protein